jgi:hypothetical protein
LLSVLPTNLKTTIRLVGGFALYTKRSRAGGEIHYPDFPIRAEGRDSRDIESVFTPLSQRAASWA